MKTYLDDILEKAKELKGLSPNEAEALLLCKDNDTIERVLKTARAVKEKIYGKRIVLFAPLYLSNECINSCLYCGFQRDNSLNDRKTLTFEELKEETKTLIESGVKRILLVSSESNHFLLDDIIEAIGCCYSVKTEKGEIRRINVNIAPLSTEEFIRLKEAKIGTYQVFQETYDRKVYEKVHPKGPKRNYKFRYEAPLRAMEAGIEDIGMGVLFGLSDPVFEVKSLLNHISEMVKIFGVGPHTISVPRIKPAAGAELSYNPPYPIDDNNFAYIIAVLRLAVPYTGIILSTRERPELRDKLFGLGVSQISAASSTSPGGYNKTKKNALSQFTTSDERSLEEIVIKLCKSGYIASFCTACYRKGRVGEDFMALVKSGNIKNFCNVNALFSLAEYATNFLEKGNRQFVIDFIKQILQRESNSSISSMINDIYDGERDVYL